MGQQFTCNGINRWWNDDGGPNLGDGDKSADNPGDFASELHAGVLVS
jgi:hypothetical protein